MSSDSIYLVSNEGGLQRVKHQLYASEELLQNLISAHPELLAGEQIDPENPPRWLLLKQEAPIPDASDSSGRWWIDHLLLDQFGTPTFVEVKRSTDTRIRREVIGQMLDYVANASAYWPAGRLRQMLAEGAGSIEASDARIAEHLGLADEPEVLTPQIDRFWKQVELNLQEGSVRLLFVADELPRETRRLIEFLNEHFTKIEVLGIELRQYVGHGVKALVPRVVGQTELARDRKDRLPGHGTSTAGQTGREAFLAASDADSAAFFGAVLDAAAGAGFETRWGTRGFSLRLKIGGAPVSVLYGYPPGSATKQPAFEAYLGYLASEILRTMLTELFEVLPGFQRATEKTIRCVLGPGTRADAPQTIEAIRRFADAAGKG